MTTPVYADALARVDAAWRARVSGATWKQAADIAGYANASNAINAVRNHYGELPQIERDELRRLWRDRLETLWTQNLQDVIAGKPGAVTAGVRIVHEAAMLDGLHEPFTITTQITADFSSLMASIEAAGVFGAVVAGEVE